MELVFGQGFDVYDEENGWALGRVVSLVPQTSRQTYVGCVSLDSLGAPISEPSHFISVLSAPMFSQSDLKSQIVLSLPLGAAVSVVAEEGDYFRIGEGQWLHRLHARPKTQPFQDFVEVAQLYLGQSYVWGGNGARGVDCSGLVQMSSAVCGIDSPRDASQQELHLGERLDFNEGDALPDLQRGDLLFWLGHVGILSAPDSLLHANATHMMCVEEPLLPALQRMSEGGVDLRSIRRF